MRRTVLSRSLSAKILLLTVACVLLGEVLIYVPSIARFRQDYLAGADRGGASGQPRLTPELTQRLDMDTVDTLLGHAGVLAFTVHGRARPDRDAGRDRLPVDRVYDLRDDGWTDADRATPSTRWPIAASG